MGQLNYYASVDGLCYQLALVGGRITSADAIPAESPAHVSNLRAALPLIQLLLDNPEEAKLLRDALALTKEDTNG